MQRKNVKNALKNSFRYALLLGVLLSLTACSTVGYYGQSVVGHNRLMWAREPIDKLIKTAEPELKSQLELAQRIRQFSIEQLGLPDNASYSTYVDLQRDYPVWTIVAAQEFSLSPKVWCYPVIGCASYRGYFAEQAALNYADKLNAQGLETNVGGAIAYSTLGWFSDPLLPSMMRYGEAELAENMFHELAHQVLYVNGNSSFNEAFASVVGEQGALRWLQQNKPELLASYQRRLELNAQFIALLNDAKQQLIELYSQDMPVQQKRFEKTRQLEQIQTNYQVLKNTQWNGQTGFDAWFSTPINNARLAAISTYRDDMPRLEELFVKCEEDFTRFYRVLKKLSKAYPAESLLTNLPLDCENEN